MRSSIYPALQYVEYFLRRENRHSLQSPFVYQLYQGLKTYRAKHADAFSHIEKLRENLLSDHTTITVRELGAGSRIFSSQERKIREIARYSCSSRKFSLLYQYFCSLSPAETVLELGTCLGINTCYLAEVTHGRLYTMEGSEELLRQAEKALSGYKKIKLIVGDISETLPTFLKNQPQIDFVLIDANHTYEHTLAYFEQVRSKVHDSSVVVIGDIHWSREMNDAWREIIHLNEVRLSLDFYECGVLLFKNNMEKQHYILSY